MDSSKSNSTIDTTGNGSSRVELNIPEKSPKNEQSKSCSRESKPLATNDFEALLHVVKSSLGSGILAMPVAYKNAGLLQGLLGTIFVGIICTHGSHLLVYASQKMCNDLKKPSLGYAETVEAVFKTSSHHKLKENASLARKIVDVFLFVTYFGSNTIYVVLIASSIQEVLKNQCEITWNIRWFMIIILLPLIVVGTIRSMKYLVPFSMLANVLLLIGLIITFYYVLQDIPPISSRPLIVHYTKMPIFFSTVVCGLEGIGTILPIENSMKHPLHFLGCPGVLNFSMVIVVSLFTSVGFFGFLKYGEDVKGSITLNLPSEFTAESIKIVVGLAILFTYGLQMTTVIEVVWRYVRDKFEKQNQDIAYYLIRGFLVITTVLSAIAVPQLAPVTSLIGAIGFSTLGLFIPALVDIIITSENVGFRVFSYNTVKNVFLIFLSTIGLITGSYTSVLDIIHEYK